MRVLLHPSTIIHAALALALSLGLVGSAQAGGWVRAPGHVYLELGLSGFAADGIWQLDGSFLKQPELDYQAIGGRVYAEVGVWKDLAVGFSLPYTQATNTGADGLAFTRNDFGNLSLFTQYQIWRGFGALAAQLRVSTPLYEGSVAGVNQQTGWVSESLPAYSLYFPAMGDGSTDLSLQAQWGMSLPVVSGWLTADLGPRFRSSGFGHTVDAALGIGVYVWPERLALTGHVEGWRRLTTDNERPTSNLLQAGGGLWIPLWAGLALTGRVSHVLDGAFTARGLGWSLGVGYQGAPFAGAYEDDPADK